MSDQDRRRLLEAHWEQHANVGDFDAAHAIYHDDAVLEWPQSGERFVGRGAFEEMRKGAPPLKFITWRIVGTGDLWVAENLMSMPDGEPRMCISVLEFRGDKVAREVVYITERFVPAAERAAWAEHVEIPGIDAR